MSDAGPSSATPAGGDAAAAKRGREPAAQQEPAVKMPRKTLYRARAHGNPLSAGYFAVPLRPEDMDWSQLYPERCAPPGSEPKAQVAFLDVGCGFGGLTVRLAELYPDQLVLGMELRDKVTEYVKERIAALREAHPGQYQNAGVLRTNAMKYLTNYFAKGQLQKMFFLFPDPHFKVSNHRRRIIQHTLLAEYAYLLAPGGRLYTITDVEDLGDWMRDRLDAHPLFRRLSDAQLEGDPAAGILTEVSEEGKKVARNGGSTWRAVYERIGVSEV